MVVRERDCCGSGVAFAPRTSKIHTSSRQLGRETRFRSAQTFLIARRRLVFNGDVKVALALATLALVVATTATATAGPTLSTKDAAKAIAKRARADGLAGAKVDVCRRINPIRVVCHLVTTTGGQDRYVAYRGSKGRIRVAHRPILQPAYG
jgi:hypothetical protein